ncbi:MAG: hypothetical protein R2796_06775 [Chitinophagaceae bacterium]|nr:hypothetical protein [Chitinophagaceae bacterium]HQU56774.1 hypothetical protein [Chitinophagaceae bacterium]HQV06894.1 hypothetical protein [Chitinophagaceae bacterium]
MENKKDHIEEILGSLDNVQRATAPDFFYTRLKARMEKGLEEPVQKSWTLRPAFILVTLLLVLALNAFVIFKGNASLSSSDNDTMQSIASDYSLNSSITYEINH